jgi:hypothetical protein
MQTKKSVEPASRRNPGILFLEFSAIAIALIVALTPATARAQQQPDPYTTPQSQANVDLPAPPRGPLPDTLAIADGAALQVRSTGALSSDWNGDHSSFIGVLVQPVVVDGWVIARAGQYIVGEAARPGKNTDVSLTLNYLILADGELVRIQTAPTSAAAGLPPQSALTFHLAGSVSFPTASGHDAFRAVTANDYTDFPLGHAAVKIPYGYDPPCCVDQYGNGSFAGDGYGYNYYYGPGYFPAPIQIRYYGWHGQHFGW